MKPINILIFFLCLSFLSCTKEVEETSTPIDYSAYNITAIKNGEPWSSNIGYYLLKNDSLLFYFEVLAGTPPQIVENVRIGNIPVSAENDTVYFEFLHYPEESFVNTTKPYAELAYWVHFDAIGKVHFAKQLENFPSWVTFEKTSDKEIAGTFQIAFYDTLFQSPYLPDTVFLEQGNFTARLWE